MAIFKGILTNCFIKHLEYSTQDKKGLEAKTYRKLLKDFEMVSLEKRFTKVIIIVIFNHLLKLELHVKTVFFNKTACPKTSSRV